MGPVLHSAFSFKNYEELLCHGRRPPSQHADVCNPRRPGHGAHRCTHRLGGDPYALGLGQLFDVTATLPFAIAGTVLAIGLVIAFNSGAIVLTGGWLILVLAYTVRKLPFTVRTSSGILHQIDPSLEEASISLGVSPLFTFLRLVVPLMLGGIISGMVLTWVTVASELSSTVVLYSGPWRTLTIVMFQALEGTGAGIAVAAASSLIAVPLIPVMLAYRLLRRYELSML